MIKYFAKRIAIMVVALFMIMLLTFTIMHSIPGGPFTTDRAVSEEVEAALNAKYNLDAPLHEQFFDYLNGVLHGDFGPSYKYTGKSVNDFIDCDGAAKTGAAQFLGIPLAWWGIFFYIVILFLTFVDKLKQVKFLSFLEVFKTPQAYITTLGTVAFTVSMILAGISLFGIHHRGRRGCQVP